MARCQSMSYIVILYQSISFSCQKTSAKMKAQLQFKLGRLPRSLISFCFCFGQAAEVHCQTRPTKSWTPSLLAPCGQPPTSPGHGGDHATAASSSTGQLHLHIRYAYLNMYTFLYLCLNLCVYMHVYIIIYPFIYLFIYLFVCLFVCLSICLFIHLSISSFICMCIYIYIYTYHIS